MRVLELSLILILLSATKVMAAIEVNYMVIQNQAQPFQNHINKQQHNGIVTDVVKKIFADPKFDLKIHTLPFNRMITMLEKEKLKNWITFGSPNWPGVQSKNLSEIPIFNVQHSFLTSKEQSLNINSAEDLFGKTVVLLHGFDYPGLEKYIADKKISAIKVKSYASAFKVVNRLGDKAGFVEMDVRIKYNLKMQNLLERDFNIHGFSNVISNYDLHLAMSPKFNKDLQAHVEKELKKLQQSGNLQTIISAY